MTKPAVDLANAQAPIVARNAKMCFHFSQLTNISLCVKLLNDKYTLALELHRFFCYLEIVHYLRIQPHGIRMVINIIGVILHIIRKSGLSD